MKVFVDANVLVSVINKEYPLFTYNSRILSLAGSSGYQISTSPVCLAIAFYFAEKKYKGKAKDKITLLCKYIEICDTTAACVLQSLGNKQIKDFEDGLQYYSAENGNCDCIVTEDVHDFYFSKLEVLSGEDFFMKYMSRIK